MKKFRTIISAILSATMLALPALADEKTGKVYIPPVFEPLDIRVSGRNIEKQIQRFKTRSFKDAPAALPVYEHQWPSVYYETSVESRDLVLHFDDAFNRYKLYVNGELQQVITKPGNTLYVLDSDKTRKAHVRLEKISESQSTAGTFRGFLKYPDDKPLPLVQRTRQIEFIGDSFTVGYGNTSSKHECTQDEVWDTTDTSQAFGPMTAKFYDADYHINAFSGRGMVRNYNGLQADTLPSLYKYALFDGKTVYEDPQWHPQLIVIGLGTNDFSTALHGGEAWKNREALRADYRDTYVAFVKRLRAQNPKAQFLLMASDQARGEIRDQVLAVAKALKDSGETRVDTLIFSGLDYGGCHGHPSVTDHQKLSALIKGWIDARPDVWR